MLREALTERQAPVKAASVSPTTKVSVVAEMWLREVERLVDAGRRSPGTFNAYRSIYRRHVDPALRALRIREVTTPVVDRMLAQIKVRSVSNARTSRLVTAGLMRFAARQGAIVVNPVREVAQIEGTPRRRPRALTGEERQAWLAALESSQKAQDWDLPDLIRFLLATGCRIGEALAVGWDDVDLGEGTVEIRSRLVRRSGVGLLRLPSTKSGRQGERLVPLPGWAVEMLRGSAGPLSVKNCSPSSPVRRGAGVTPRTCSASGARCVTNCRWTVWSVTRCARRWRASRTTLRCPPERSVTSSVTPE